MATQEDANLILKLYELRREETLRKARQWFAAQFRPQSVQDIVDTINGEQSAYFRMVISYWDMACALVNHGTIDRDLFCETNGEQFVFYAKLEPFLPQLREQFKNPRLLLNLEKLVKESAHGQETVARWQARWKAEAAAAAANA